MLARHWAYCALIFAMVLPLLSRASQAARGSAAERATASAPADDARAWLARTDRALAQRNYRGVFVHEYGGDTETLQVIHRVGSDGVSERLVSMDGSGREFVRHAGELSCYLPDLRTVLVVKSPRPMLPLNVPELDGDWAGQYDVRQIAVTRISGHRARVIAVTPLDSMRYGYRLWIDDETAMPLKTQLRDRRGAVLEQILFTHLALPAHIADSELRPAVDARGYRWVQQSHYASVADAPPALGASTLPIAWQKAALPAGFRMTASGHQVLPSGPAEHLVFSDGLASVSVFIQPSHTPRNVHISDAATLATSSAYSTVVPGYRITAVGEVPPQTVRAIAQAVVSTAAAASLGRAAPAAAGVPTARSPLPTLGVNGAGALFIIGALGNGNLAGANGGFNGFGSWPVGAPYRPAYERAGRTEGAGSADGSRTGSPK